MRTLYVAQQGCYVGVSGEMLVVKQGKTVFGEVQLPLVEMVLIFGKSQVSTQAIRACLRQDIPIAYLSRMGYCYGRILPIERGYRHLSRYQQQLTPVDQLVVARRLVEVKLRNSRVILQRQHRRQKSDEIGFAIQNMEYFIDKAAKADNLDRLMGYEGAVAREYFAAFSHCLSRREFVFEGRSRRPPGNPVNAMLSFGYQVLWNHLLTLIELQGLDPYSACLHQGNERHAALASDLIEEFRAPIVDSLVMYLVNKSIVDIDQDFVYHDGGCFLNDTGRRKYLTTFVQRMEEEFINDRGDKQPKWDLLNQQVKEFKQFVYAPSQVYQPYQIR